MNKLLFVYGSLLNAGNEFAIYLNSNSSRYSTAEFKGRLYDIGEYPGAITDTNSGYTVKGIILSLNNPEDNFKVLDDYEGFGPDQLQPNLFIRRSLPVTTANGPVNCWLYLYNLPVNDLFEITTGGYLSYLDQQKKR